MQVVFDPDEAWSIMMLVVARVVDGVELSEEGRDGLRKWRSARDAKSPEMRALVDEMNASLAGVTEERTRRRQRRLRA